MSTYGLVNEYNYRLEHMKPEWYKAERYDFCEQLPRRERFAKQKRFINPLHYLFAHIF